MLLKIRLTFSCKYKYSSQTSNTFGEKNKAQWKYFRMNKKTLANEG